MRVASITLVLLPLVAACASPSTDYPSLAIRDAERVAASPEREPGTAPAEPIPSDLAARVRSLRDQANVADRAFREKVPGVTSQLQAARGSAIASKGWSSAQTALSDLDSHRSTTAIALADLDKLYAARALELQRRDFIDEARGEVASILARQDETLKRLQGMIAP